MVTVTLTLKLLGAPGGMTTTGVVAQAMLLYGLCPAELNAATL